MKTNKTEAKPAHTPGPWKDISGLWVAGPDGEQIADCVTKQNDGEMSHEVKAANARLIAAAPDLLAACQVAMDEFAIGTFNASRRARAAEFIRAAILRAQGGR